MTPFDGTALLAMLLSFYPSVNGSELARARRERPEYFAGGLVFGSKGDKLGLPDGRVFDLIFASGGLPGQQRWQVIEPGPGDVGDPFPLEAGPLTPIDAGLEPAPGEATTFQALVADAVESLGASDGVLAAASQRVTEAAASGVLVDDGGGELADVEQVVAEIERSRDADALAEIVGQVESLAQAIEVTDSEYDEAPVEPPVPDITMPVQEPDPDNDGQAPGKEGGPETRPGPGEGRD